MRWFKTTLLRSSIHAMLSVSTARPRPPDPPTIDEIREAILGLGELEGGERSAGLAVQPGVRREEPIRLLRSPEHPPDDEADDDGQGDLHGQRTTGHDASHQRARSTWLP